MKRSSDILINQGFLSGIVVIFLLWQITLLRAQVEHVPVTNPVYMFLQHSEIKGILPHFSSSELPLQKSQVTDALKTLRKNAEKLSGSELNTLLKFEKEFGIKTCRNSILFYSGSDSNQILFRNIFSDDEKYIYHYKDSIHNANLSPLGNIDGIYYSGADSANRVILGNLGLRFYGSLSGIIGYYLQATNGVIISGDKNLALYDSKIRQNVKFTQLNSDFDFTESHIRLQYDWFYAIIGRETRYLGSGINQRMFISGNAPPMDALSLGARFEGFEYRFTHFNMLSMPDSTSLQPNGSFTRIPPKYMAMHRFALKPEWGEIALNEYLIYANRPVDLAYINPLSFYKSLEHSLHDRDNSLMGAEITLRPLANIQLKGSFLLDDIVISEIGKSFWSNKTAWNTGFSICLPFSFDVGFEYSRIEPYTYSHFNPLLSVVNDNFLIGTALPPNSDETAMILQYFFGGRYPLIIRAGYQRHGSNVYDTTGKLIKNVGGDPLQVKRPEDSERVVFLDGIRNDAFFINLQCGYELLRGFNLKGSYTFVNNNGLINNYFRFIFSIGDF